MTENGGLRNGAQAPNEAPSNKEGHLVETVGVWQLETFVGHVVV
jgi:hypothetical protein